jgi:hypothetical protein
MKEAYENMCTKQAITVHLRSFQPAALRQQNKLNCQLFSRGAALTYSQVSWRCGTEFNALVPL